jgi:hypothetical protein
MSIALLIDAAEFLERRERGMLRENKKKTIFPPNPVRACECAKKKQAHFHRVKIYSDFAPENKERKSTANRGK